MGAGAGLAGAVAEAGQVAGQGLGVAADRLLRADPGADCGLQPLAHLALAADQVAGAGRLGLAQARLRVGRRGGWSNGLAFRAVGEPRGQGAEGLRGGRREGRIRRGVLGAAHGLGLRGEGVGGTQGPHRRGDPRLVRGGLGLRGVARGRRGGQAALVLGQLGGELVGGGAAVQGVGQAFQRGLHPASAAARASRVARRAARSSRGPGGGTEAATENFHSPLRLPHRIRRRLTPSAASTSTRSCSGLKGRSPENSWTRRPLSQTVTVSSEPTVKLAGPSVGEANSATAKADWRSSRPKIAARSTMPRSSEGAPCHRAGP